VDTHTAKLSFEQRGGIDGRATDFWDRAGEGDGDGGHETCEDGGVLHVVVF
jgi:hypothetical protein